MRARSDQARSVVRCPNCGAKVRVPAEELVLEGVPIEDEPQPAPPPASHLAPPPVRVPNLSIDPPPAPDPAKGADAPAGDDEPPDDAQGPYYDDIDTPARPPVNPALVAVAIGLVLVAGVALCACLIGVSQGPADKTARGPGQTRPVAAAAPPREPAPRDPTNAIGAGVSAVVIFYILISILIGIPIFIAPTVIAFWRQHPSRLAILALNFTLGWVVLGWVLALVWALADTHPREQVHVHYHRKRPP
jgi:hypothetical protein